MKRVKRLLALLMAVAIILTNFPSEAFAASMADRGHILWEGHGWLWGHRLGYGNASQGLLCLDHELGTGGGQDGYQLDSSGTEQSYARIGYLTYYYRPSDANEDLSVHIYAIGTALCYDIAEGRSFGKITSAGSYTYLVRATIRSYHLENNQLVNRQQTVILSETVTEFTVVKPDYTVTFNANGGTCSISSMSVQAGKTLSGFPDVTRKGYNFLGWYTQTSGGTQVTLSTKIQSSMTLYAQWEKIDLGEACGKNVYWKLQNGVLTISGTGAMTDYSDADSVPWHDTKSSIHSVIVGQGVTNIGSYAFDGCTELTSVTLSEGLTAIGSSAFAGCGKLTGITMPATLKTIGEKAFISCVVLTDVVIPYGVTAIGADAFSCMSSLSSITVPATVTGIGDRCFAFSTNLTAVSLGGKPASMGSNLLMMDTKAVIYYRTDSGWNAAAKSAFVGTQSNLSWKSVGDVNGDGSVTLKDVSAAFNAVKGTKALTCTFQMSDVHVDGKLTLRDVAAIFDLVS